MDLLDQLGLWVLLGHQETEVHQVFQVQLAHWGQGGPQDHKAREATPVCQVKKAPQAHLVCQDHQDQSAKEESEVRKDQWEKMDSLELLEELETRVHQELLVLWAHLGHLVYRGHRALPVPLVLLVPEAIGAKLVLKV